MNDDALLAEAWEAFLPVADAYERTLAQGMLQALIERDPSTAPKLAALCREYGVACDVQAYSDDQARDEHGRWTEGGGIEGEALTGLPKSEWGETHKVIEDAYPALEVAARMAPRFEQWLNADAALTGIGPCGAVSQVVAEYLKDGGVDARVMGFDFDDGTQYGSPHLAVVVYRKDTPAAIVDLSNWQFDDHLPTLIYPHMREWNLYRGGMLTDPMAGGLWDQRDVARWQTRLKPHDGRHA